MEAFPASGTASAFIKAKINNTLLCETLSLLCIPLRNQ